MLKRGLAVVALAAALLTVSPVPAQAIPPGNNLIVVAYYDSPAKQNLVGQAWNGCGQPSGSWGVTSPYRTIFFTPC